MTGSVNPVRATDLRGVKEFLEENAPALKEVKPPGPDAERECARCKF